MYQSRSVNNKINGIQESHASKNFKKINPSISTRKIYKVKMSIFPIIMNEPFRFNKNFVYSLRGGSQSEKPSIYTFQFGGESTVYLGAKICHPIPENIKTFISRHF